MRSGGSMDGGSLEDLQKDEDEFRSWHAAVAMTPSGAVGGRARPGEART